MVQIITKELSFEDEGSVSLTPELQDLLRHITQTLDVSIELAGSSHLRLTGPEDKVAIAASVITRLYTRLSQGNTMTQAEVEAAMRMASMDMGRAQNPDLPPQAFELSIPTSRYMVLPRSAGQGAYMDALKQSELVFVEGPAGTGKTYLAVAMGVSMLLAGVVDRIILSRPVVEAGEHLGFLPGDLKEKIDPYLRPLYDALFDMMPGDKVNKRLERGEIEVAPLAFMRGRTLSKAFIILDEAQNTTEMQMKMFLTRLGEGSRMVITGDLSQIDLPGGVRSGLRQALYVVEGIEGVRICRLSRSDVVRHPLVGRIVEAYESKVGLAGART